ncbi:hypothetical protein HNY73_015241 [Argiope bruennichi]|uniref:Uncharacterized protein n=1 Tax=Argiope bruennichi TaxID=94029 RepID=A0A8T0ES04_ARGBR|nr:hypothetical protein HNY73_015241 [Argiope bruennichi]
MAERSSRRRHLSKKQKDFLKKTLLRLLAVLSEEVEEEMNATKRTWVKKWIRKRDELGTSNLLLKELAAEDPKEYCLFLRLTPEMFNNLLCRISDTIQRQNTIMRGSLSAKIKLELTLTFLASGCSYRTLSHLFRVPKSTISSTISEVLDAIYESLNEFIKV